MQSNDEFRAVREQIMAKLDKYPLYGPRDTFEIYHAGRGGKCTVTNVALNLSSDKVYKIRYTCECKVPAAGGGGIEICKWNEDRLQKYVVQSTVKHFYNWDYQPGGRRESIGPFRPGATNTYLV